MMDVELLIGNEMGTRAFLPAVEEGIEWQTDRRGAPGKLTFKVLTDDVLDFSEGSAVRLRVDGDEIFYGFVFKQSRDKDRLSFSSSCTFRFFISFSRVSNSFC